MTDTERPMWVVVEHRTYSDYGYGGEISERTEIGAVHGPYWSEEEAHKAWSSPWGDTDYEVRRVL